ncbi:MAG: hypothetical protein VYB54_07460 [Pseudomonadota bacterium]|nr:hypothetical protein [Pseudomonadota bacterium]
MPDTEFQLRRGTGAANDALTGAAGEPTFDTTNNRLRLHDGSRAGGWPVPIFRDVQNGTFVAATAGGSADALTITLSPAPAAYAAGQAFWILAAADNTGSATLNVNSLNVKTLKRQVAGAKQNLSAGDIKTGRPYLVFYDGTDFVVFSAQDLGEAVSSEITVSTGDQSYSLTHGLGARPRHYDAFLLCKTADLNYAVDDEIKVTNFFVKVSSAAAWGGVTVRANATQVIVQQERDIYLPDVSGGTPSVIDYADWKLVIRCRA